MIKVILFVRRKPGLSREEFKRYYESNHAPLVRRHVPPLKKYVRNFLAPSASGAEPEYDCVTEFWFQDKEGWDATRAWSSTPEGKILAQDEENFMDRSSMRVFVADECASPD